MEAGRVNSDVGFLTRKPFGLLMSGQTVLSLTAFILIFFAPFIYEGMGFVRVWSLSMFLISLLINIAHVMGWHRRVFLVGGRGLFFPFTFTLFIVCIFFMLCFAFSSILCIISVFDSFRYSSTSLAVTYVLLSVCVVLLTFICARLAILIFRAAPNSKILQLVGVVIDGERAVSLEARFAGTRSTSGIPTTQVPPTGVLGNL